MFIHATRKSVASTQWGGSKNETRNIILHVYSENSFQKVIQKTSGHSTLVWRALSCLGFVPVRENGYKSSHERGEELYEYISGKVELFAIPKGRQERGEERERGRERRERNVSSLEAPIIIVELFPGRDARDATRAKS